MTNVQDDRDFQALSEYIIPFLTKDRTGAHKTTNRPTIIFLSNPIESYIN
jgi:hypothetical protein